MGPADPHNCADGFANWVVGWSVGKKEWCCRVHGKGCPGQGAGCAPVGTVSPPYDCNAGFANWAAGWSVPKKQWCCQNHGKGCATTGCGHWRERHLPVFEEPCCPLPILFLEKTR